MDAPLVSISCTTYNHENYIKDALEGFLMQKTEFDFEILIHDDASTDKTATIIKEYENKYPSIIKPIYQTENQYSKGAEINYKFNYKRAKGKYIAICEGDDFWIDSLKLQKQVDYLKTHPSCSLCVHAAKIICGIKVLGDVAFGYAKPNDINKQYHVEDVIQGGGGMFATNSMIFPTKLVKELPDFYFDSSVGDYPLAIYLSLYGDVYYMSDIMSVYRVMAINSWSRSIRDDLQKEINIYKSINNMLLQFSKFSNFAYSDAVKECILQNQFRINLKQGKYKELQEGAFKKVYSKLNFRFKCELFLKTYFPGIARALIKVKRKFLNWILK